MKTQKELIAHFIKYFKKVSSAQGVESDYSTYAFYLLQAAKMNIPEAEIFAWAKAKCDELQTEALDLC